MSKRRAEEQPESWAVQLSAFAAKRIRSLPTSPPLAENTPNTKPPFSNSESESGIASKIRGLSHLGQLLTSSPWQPRLEQSPHPKRKTKSHDVVLALPRSPSNAEISDDSSNILSSEDLASGHESDNNFQIGTHPTRAPRLKPLSTFTPSAKNVLRNVKSGVVVKLKPGETLASLGQYDFRVRKGVVTLMGATLRKSPTLYRVYAPSTHSIPVVRCVGTSQIVSHEAEIEFGHCDTGLHSLGKLSPLFGRIWSEGYWEPHRVSLLTGVEKRSFMLMCDSKKDPSTRPLEVLEIPTEWHTSIQALCDNLGRRPPKILVCGPKSSGKSTFVRQCCNHILTMDPTRNSAPDGKGLLQNDGVALMDLDPGQPEYSAPGQLSLIHLRTPTFGPPYTHPILPSTNDNRLVRAHNIAAISPKDDPRHYTACALDLLTHYQELHLKHPSCTLVINCSGWIFGPGLEVTIELIQKLAVTDTVYMSREGLLEIVDSLKEATQGIAFHMLPSQPSQCVSRTSAESRSMQALSYFHCSSSRSSNLSWCSTPISSMRPWKVRYTGQRPGIHGIMVYGERQPPDLLSTIMDGSLVAIVVIDKNSDIFGCDEPSPGQYGETPICSDAEDAVESYTNGYHTPAIGTGLDISDVDLNHGTLSRPPYGQPFIMHTAAENLPYLTSTNGVTTPLDPTKSHTIGLALIRGIDVRKEELHVLTPVPESTILALQAANAKLVFVSGKFDTPAWAYQEEYSVAAHAEMRQAKEGKTMPAVEEMGGWKGKMPWVRVLTGVEGKGVGEEVWKVRRNLKARGELMGGGTSE
ncbi:MAG: Polynucleotide 5'-hydroxyl-kinase grc3 [Candelina mexicana]|nr:MAG: Polynucleotide 5'-hydroxyl-kinase grc3 [Candelina mexicana]